MPCFLQPLQPLVSSLPRQRRHWIYIPPAASVLAALLAPHTHALQLAQLREAVTAHDRSENKGRGADGEKAVVRFFQEILQVHTIESGNKSAAADAEGPDREFEVQQHKGVAISVEDSFDAGSVISTICDDQENGTLTFLPCCEYC